MYRLVKGLEATNGRLMERILAFDVRKLGGGHNQIFAKEEDLCLVISGNRAKANG